MATPAHYFKCLSDETRLRCIALLMKQGELCVCELTEALKLSQPKISRHLALLRQSGLVLDSRRGQWVYYRINPDLPQWGLDILNTGVSAMLQNDCFESDYQRLMSILNCSEQNACKL